MNTEPKVQVCVPCYNCEDTIARTLKSIIKQSYKNLEIIVVDNCSTDNSINVIETVIENIDKPKIQLVRNESNIGGCGNFNKCLNLANAEYVCIYHSDDMYKPNIVEEQVRFMESHKDVALVFTAADIIDDDDIVCGSFTIPEKYAQNGLLGFKEIYSSIVECGNIMLCPSAMFRKKAISDFKFDASVGPAMDLDGYIEIGKTRKIGFINKNLLLLRQITRSSYSFRSLLKYKNTLEDSLIKVLIKQIAKENMEYLFSEEAFINIYNHNVKNKMILAYLNGDYKYAKSMVHEFDERIPYRKLWLWKFLLNIELPLILRKLMVYKRYKSFFKGHFDMINLKEDDTN